MDESSATRVEVCEWVGLAVAMYEEFFTFTQAVAVAVDVQPFSWPFSLWLGGCDAQIQNARDPESQPGSRDGHLATDLLRALAEQSSSGLQLTGQFQFIQGNRCRPPGSCAARMSSVMREIEPQDEFGVQKGGWAAVREDAGTADVRDSLPSVLGQGSADNVTLVGRQLLAKAAAKSSAGSGGVQAAVRTADVSAQAWTTDDVALTSSAVPGSQLPVRALGTGNVILGGILVEQVCLD